MHRVLRRRLAIKVCLSSSFGAFILFLLFGCGGANRTNPSQQSKYRFDGITNVAELVEHLVSPAPPKHPSGEWDTAPEEINGFMHPQVEAAYSRLVQMGTAIYPDLVKHLKDERYSYSIISAAWLNESVGDALVDIMAEGIEFNGYGYKWRKNATTGNGPPDFAAMATEIGWQKYAEYASTRSKSDLQKKFVRWKLKKERDFGFTDSEQEQEVTGPYLKWLADH